LSVGHIAPAEQCLAFGADRRSDLAFAGGATGGIARQEHHADAVIACGRQCEIEVAANAAQKGVGNLNQYARTVAHQRVRAGGATVGEVLENLQTLLDQGMVLLAFDMRNKADAARVVFVCRVV